MPLEGEALLRDIRNRVRKERDAVSSLVAAAQGQDVEAAIDALIDVEDLGQLPAALRRLSRQKAVQPAMQAMFLRWWINCGESIRTEAGRDRDLLNALRALLPVYRGQAATLYRGEGFRNRCRRTYGLAWTIDPEVADAFARGLWQTTLGGSVVLATNAPPEAILAAVDGCDDDRFCEAEYLVDRRRLGKVSVMRRYPQRPH